MELQKVVSTKVKFGSFDEILNVPWGFRSWLWGNGEELQDERTFAFPTESSSSQTWCISFDHVWQSLLKFSCHKDEPLPFQFSEKCTYNSNFFYSSKVLCMHIVPPLIIFFIFGKYHDHQIKRVFIFFQMNDLKTNWF